MQAPIQTLRTEWEATALDQTRVTIALSDSRTSDPIPTGSALLQELSTTGLRPVEFRLRLDGEWRWGHGAMAACELVIDGKATPLQELWQQGTAR